MKYLSMPCNSRRNQFEVLLKNGIGKNPRNEIMFLGHGAKKGKAEN